MASHDGNKFVYATAVPYPDYPDWDLVDCGCCAGIKWGGWTPEECRDCKGAGSLARHRATGLLALYPGGPIAGRDADGDLLHRAEQEGA